MTEMVTHVPPVRRLAAGPSRALLAQSLWLACLSSVLFLTSACQTKPNAPGPTSADTTVESPVSADAPAPVPSDVLSGTPIDEMPLPEGEFTFEGGDGTSLEQAVIVNAPSERIGVAALYGWIGRRYPSSTAAGQNTIIQNGRFYDAIDIVTATKERRTFYFDITQFFGKF